MSAARRRPEPVLLTALVLLAAAAVFAAVAGWSWAGAPRVPAAAAVRDQALQAGEQAVLNFNTLDYRHVGSGLKLWEESSTGSLHAQDRDRSGGVREADRGG